MTIGGSIALIIIGAILAYAVNYEFSGIDIRLVGIILMVGGAIGLIVGIVRIASARRSVERRPRRASARSTTRTTTRPFGAPTDRAQSCRGGTPYGCGAYCCGTAPAADTPAPAAGPSPATGRAAPSSSG